MFHVNLPGCHELLIGQGFPEGFAGLSISSPKVSLVTLFWAWVFPYTAYIGGKLRVGKTSSFQTRHAVDSRNPANQLIGSLSHNLDGFIHPRWCRISYINSISTR